MNIQSNPWSFVAGDINNQAIVASPGGLTQSTASPRVVTLTTSGVHGFLANQFLTLYGITNAGYNGYYKIIRVPTTTTAVLESISRPTAGSPIDTILAASGGGHANLIQYKDNVRIEDLNWQSDTTANDTLDVRDRNGNVVWQSKEGGASRGKLVWVDGISLVQMSGGILIVTVD
jgi:hypothetical protein